MPRTGFSADEIKERALDIALDHIRLLGFDKVRLTLIARQLGVSHAALYAHFADKSALLDGVTERWLAHVERTVAKVVCVPAAPTDRMLQWLIILYRIKRERALTEPELHRAFDVSAALAKTFVADHLNNLLGQITHLFTEAGTLFPGNPAHNAQLLYTATAAYHHPTLVAQSAHSDQEPMLCEIVELTLRGLKSAPVE